MAEVATEAPRWPETSAQWDEAVAAAVFSLGLHSCYLYGLLTGPDVDVARCDLLLEEARRRGVRIPTLEEVLR